MLDTIMPRSSGGTTARITPSTLATSFSVTARRVPVGALRLITNWPASVRGKKESPSSGNNARQSTRIEPVPASVTAGCRKTTPTSRSYCFRKDSKPSLNHTLKRRPIDKRGGSTATGSSEDGVPWWEGVLMNRAQNSGTTVMATTKEANSDRTTARAKAENRNLLTPYKKVTAKKTTTVVSVAANTGKATSFPPLVAAS